MNNELCKIRLFTDLNVWKEAHKLVLMIYNTTNDFPKSEIFGLISQLRRAAISVTSNIAEGFSRHTYKQKINFYSIALGSLTELQNQIIVAKDILYINMAQYDEIFAQSVIVHKMINGLIKTSKIYLENHPRLHNS